jgi:hypothetical protein
MIPRFAVTHKRLGGYLGLVRVSPSLTDEPVPWLRAHPKPDSTFATREEAEKLRSYVGDDFYNCYEVVEVEP